MTVTAEGRVQTWLVVKCCVCGKTLGVKEGYGVSGESHGYCQQHYAEALAEIDAMERQEAESWAQG